MKHATIARVLLAGVVAAAALIGSACTTHSQEAPPLTGPSELGLSITVSVSPDILTQDGASQSIVTIAAHDSNGGPKPNVGLRAEIAVGGVRADFGTISARNLVTDSAGKATLVYTAPTVGTGPAVDTGTVVDILVTPIGFDFGNSSARLASIRLVPPGIIVPPDGLQPRFTVAPVSPIDHQPVLFDASTSRAGANNAIAGYAWDFGDGGTGSGRTATHAYNTAGTYFAKLTISDSIGRAASTTQTIDVGQGAAPKVAFTFSPSDPLIGQIVNFNASSTIPEAGRTIQSYSWDFGDGTQKTTSSVLTTHDFMAGGSYTVTLVATDDTGHTGTSTQTVDVASDAPKADFTFSPKAPGAGVNVNFNAGASIPAPGRTIVSYFWDFGGFVTSTSATPTITFPVGDWDVLLIVTDNAGKTGRVTKTVTVK